MAEPGSGRLRRLAEELTECGLRLDGADAVEQMLLEEIERPRKGVLARVLAPELIVRSSAIVPRNP